MCKWAWLTYFFVFFIEDQNRSEIHLLLRKADAAVSSCLCDAFAAAGKPLCCDSGAAAPITYIPKVSGAPALADGSSASERASMGRQVKDGCCLWTWSTLGGGSSRLQAASEKSPSDKPQEPPVLEEDDVYLRVEECGDGEGRSFAGLQDRNEKASLKRGGVTRR